MKKTLLIIGLTALIVAVIVTVLVYNNNIDQIKKEHQVQLNIVKDTNEMLVMKLNERDSLINDYVTTFNLIEKDLKYIKEQENILDTKSKDPEFSKDQKQGILNDVKLVNSLLDQNKKRIAELNRKLKTSGVQISGLNDKVEMLAKAIEERDKNMTELKDQLQQKDFQIAQLNEKVGEMDSVVNAQYDIIKDKKDELNKGYLASGNYKELKEKGIVTKEGGFLLLGQNVTLSDNINPKDFKKIDITQTTTIPVHSKKAKLITTHPEGSYEWVSDSGQIAYMVIDYPEKFWSVSKYAVLETK